MAPGGSTRYCYHITGNWLHITCAGCTGIVAAVSSCIVPFHAMAGLCKQQHTGTRAIQYCAVQLPIRICPDCNNPSQPSSISTAVLCTHLHHVHVTADGCCLVRSFCCCWQLHSSNPASLSSTSAACCCAVHSQCIGTLQTSPPCSRLAPHPCHCTLTQAGFFMVLATNTSKAAAALSPKQSWIVWKITAAFTTVLTHTAPNCNPNQPPLTQPPPPNRAFYASQ